MSPRYQLDAIPSVGQVLEQNRDKKGRRLLPVRNRSTVQPLKSAYIDRSRRAEAFRASESTWAVFKPRAAKTVIRARRSHNRPVAFVVADEKKCCAWADANGVSYTIHNKWTPPSSTTRCPTS